ncbi:MAG: PQQ-binding-like beta-propeller repeat protein, partial [Planctomycetota bacterium]
ASLGKVHELPHLYYDWMASLFLRVIHDAPCKFSFYTRYLVEDKVREPILNAPLNFREILLQALIKIEKWEQFIQALPIAKHILPIKSGKILDVNTIPIDELFPQIRERLQKNIAYTEIEALNSLSVLETMVVIVHFIRDGFFCLSEEFYELAKLFEISQKEDLQCQTLEFMQEFYPCEYQIFEALGRYWQTKKNPQQASAYFFETIKFLSGEDRFKSLQKILNIDSSNISAQQELIYYHLSEKRMERALPLAKKVVYSLIQASRVDEARAIAQYFIQADQEAPAFYSFFIKEYKSKNNPEKLLEILKEISVYYELRGKYEMLLSIYHQILQTDPNQPEIKEKANALKKQGIGGHSSSSSIRWIVGILFFCVVGYYFLKKPVDPIQEDPLVQERILREIQTLKDNGKIKEALQAIQPLRNISVSSPLYSRIQDILRELDSNSKTNQDLLNQYHEAQQSKHYYQANALLEKILAQTPSMMTTMEKEKQELVNQIQMIDQRYKKRCKEIEEKLEQLKQGNAFKSDILVELLQSQEEFIDFLQYAPQEKFLKEHTDYLKLNIQVDKEQFQKILGRGEELFREEKFNEALEKFQSLGSYFTQQDEKNQMIDRVQKCQIFLDKNEKQKSLMKEAHASFQSKDFQNAQQRYREVVELIPESQLAKEALEKLNEIATFEVEALSYFQALEEEVQKGNFEVAWNKAKNFPNKFQKTQVAKQIYYPLQIEHSSLILDVFKKGQFLGKTPYLLKLKEPQEPLDIELILDGYEIAIKGPQQKKPWLLEMTVNKGVRFTLETISPIECQPCLVDDNILICIRNGLLQLMNPQTGEINWKYTLPSAGEILSSPLYKNQKLYFASTTGHLLILKISSEKYTVISNQVLAKEKFEFQPILLDRMLLIGSQQGMIYGCDPETGNKKWSQTFPPKAKIRQIGSQFTEYKGFAYFATIDGRIWKISSAGEIEPSRKLDGRIVSMMSFGGNIVVATKNLGILAFSEEQLSVKNQDIKWQEQLTGEILGMSIFENKLWVSAEGSLYNFLPDGSTDLEFDFIPCRSIAEIAPDRIFVATPAGLNAYDFRGNLLWNFKFSQKISPPLFYQNMVYFGGENRIFYAIPTH